MNHLEKLCQLIRYDIITSTTEAGTGHPTSSLSAVELMTTLFFGGFLHYDLENPHNISNDRVIFSKGHASPLFYSLYHAAGAISYEELMTLRTFGSNLEGHPTPRFKYTEAATGSLGQGLSVGVGMALGIKLHAARHSGKPASWRAHPESQEDPGQARMTQESKVFVLLGDSEMAEGQIWEALQLASHYKLNNLIGILDVNRLGQRGETMLGWDLTTYQKRVESFGWNTIVVDNGHNLEKINEAFVALEQCSIPTMIIAKTKKGKGVLFLEDKDDWHGKSVPKDKRAEALKEIGEVDKNLRGVIKKPETIAGDRAQGSQHMSSLRDNGGKERGQAPQYKLDEKIATREAYGEALIALGEHDDRIVVLDAEVSNSTYSDKFKKKFPERFFEMYIAEQNMVSVALGLSKLGFIPYISTFAAFLTRAFDQIRMTQYSEGNVKIAGSHAGVSIGYDGSSQMGLEDLAMFQSLLKSTVFYPADAVSTHSLVCQAGEIPGTVYIRTTREKTPVLYNSDETFSVGGSKVLKQSEKDTAVIFAVGITLHEALKAYELLQKETINIAVVDLYSVKPIDTKTIQELRRRIKNIIVVEDHYPAGGLGEAVLTALFVGVHHDAPLPLFTHLCVRKIPRSGSPEELLRYEEIDAAAIVAAVKELL